MIIDLDRFAARRREHWQELERLLERIETTGARTLALDDARRLHYLYERASADLVRISGLTAESGTGQYLSSLVGRAYAEIYETRRRTSKVSPRRWVMATFPQTVRRHGAALALAVVLTLAGSAFGAAALVLDAGAKRVIMPFPELMRDPASRVHDEERVPNRGVKGQHSSFAAELMTHNTRVALFTIALGITWGVGSALLLFYNGVLLGAVVLDYVRAGRGMFVAGWLMPHGVIEIPAILIAGQAAFVLTSALVGTGVQAPRTARLRAAIPDVMTLAGGTGMLLIWAGLVESFISQFHQPMLPYAVKIAFGAVEAAALFGYLRFAGEPRR